MKKLLFFLAVFIFFSTSVLAQGKTEAYLSGGISFPSKPDEFRDFWGMGLNVGGGIGYPISSNLSLVAYLDYNTFAFDEGKAAYTFDEGSAIVFSISGNLRARFRENPKTISPYFILGLGYSRVSRNDAITIDKTTIITGRTSQSAVWDSYGAGIDIPTSDRTNVFIEAKYSSSFTIGGFTEYISLKIGIRLPHP